MRTIIDMTMAKMKACGLKNIKFVKGDYMKTSHSDMDLIMCYVLKVTGEPLGKKLAEEIKDDCIVISEMFPLGHLDEVKQIKKEFTEIDDLLVELNNKYDSVDLYEKIMGGRIADFRFGEIIPHISHRRQLS